MKNRFLRILLSAGIAIAIWAYVVTVVAPNTDKTFNNVPLVVQGEAVLQERKLMITDMDTDSVNLQLEGSRLDLNKLSSSNIIVTIDASKIYEAGTHQVAYSISYPGDVASNAITVMNREPGFVTVTVEAWEEKTVPIEVDYVGSVPEGFVADLNPALDISVVYIHGPKSVIDRIETARIQVDLEGKEKTFSETLRYTLCDKDKNPVDVSLVKVNAGDVTVTQEILRVKDVDLLVNIVNGGGVTAETCTITLDTATIRVSGSEELLEGLEQLEVGTINLGEITENTELVFPITLPQGINNETGVTEVKVTVTLPELATTTLRVTNITFTNKPAGMDVELITKALEVLVRGPQGQINNLKPEDITVTVDLTDVQAGSVKLKAIITINNAPDVGAVGVYTISVTVREA